MANKKLTNPRRGTTLWWIGLWATIWWAISGLYFVWWFWLAKDYLAEDMSGWISALDTAFISSPYLTPGLGLILLVWAAGIIIWLRELKRLKISYAAALRDLFLTIR